MKAEDKEKLLKDIANEAKKLVDPVNYKILEAKGIITKEGPWYRVHDINKLPHHIRAEVIEEHQDEKGTKVVFRNSPDFDKYAKQFRKLGL